MALDLRTALVIPDSHVPHHDQRAWDLMLDVARDMDIDEICLLGDFLDFYHASAYPKTDGIKEIIKDEVEIGKQILWQLKKTNPKADLYYIEGNHEFRLRKFIKAIAPGLAGLVNLTDLLSLDGEGWKLIPYGRKQSHSILSSPLIARHEPFSGGENHAKLTLKKAGGVSILYGHTHQIQHAQMVGLDGRAHGAWSCGSLVNMNSPVFNYLKNHEQWALAFCLVTVINNLHFHVQVIPIIDYKCVVNGFIYSG